MHSRVEHAGATKAHYDFSTVARNPYAERLKRQVTIRLGQATVDYFKDLAADSDVPYQTLVDPYLRDCATRLRKLSPEWHALSDADTA